MVWYSGIELYHPEWKCVKRIWKEAVVTYLKLLFLYLLGERLSKTLNNLGGDQNMRPQES
jgi:hypothetical protein